MVGDEAEVAVGGHEGQHPLLLPPAEADAGVEGHVVQHARIHERQTQVRHATQSDRGVYPPRDLPTHTPALQTHKLRSGDHSAFIFR